MAKTTKSPQQSKDLVVYDIPLSNLANANPRDSSPSLLALGYGIFSRLPDSDKPALMEMALSDNENERIAFADLIEKYEPSLANMGADIANKGLLQPIGVVQTRKGYEVVFGCRRVLAIAYSGGKTVPCRILDLNEHDRTFISYSENHQRLGQTAIDEAKYFRLMKDKLGVGVAEIASKCGVNEQHVRIRDRLNDLPEDVQNKIASGKVSITKALKAAKMGDDLDGADLEKKTTRRRLPTLRELRKWYEEDTTLSEDVRKFIAKRLLGVKYSVR